MSGWRRMGLAVLVAALALVGPVAAWGCVNNWGMTATAGNGSVTLAWGVLPEGSTAKVIRSTAGWPSDPTFGDPAPAMMVAEEKVVYEGKERSFVDTGLENGKAYWYTLFVRDDLTGAYSDKISEVISTPGEKISISTPTCSTSYVKKAVPFATAVKLTDTHACDTTARVILYKKVDGKWRYAKSGTRPLAKSATTFKAYVTAPSSGSYKMVITHDDAEHLAACSPPRFFYSH